MLCGDLNSNDRALWLLKVATFMLARTDLMISPGDVPISAGTFV
jgi:hypothetical protein